MNNFGSVYLVGAGCGDFDLITLRGMRILRDCDTVVYDSLIDNRILDFAPKDAEKICVGKRAGHHSETQETINNILVRKAKEGKNIVRLKGGDPFVFGRGGEEILALRENNIEYGIVPGISSAIAVPEFSGIPVTHRKISRSFHIITGHTAENMLPENMSAYARLDGTLVFLMGLKNLGLIADSLIQNGKAKDTPTAVISDGASVNQQIVRSTLENIVQDVHNSKIKSPAIIVVGAAAEFDFSATLKLPLQGVSVTATGTKRLVDKLSLQLFGLGADVKGLDYLNVSEYHENLEFDNALKNIYKYSWIVLTSINGAEIFLNRLKRLKIDIRKLAHIKFAVIGNGTAGVLEKSGIYPDLIPAEYTSVTLGRELVKYVRKNEKVMILRSRKGSLELSKILSDRGVLYDDIKTYDVSGNIEKVNSNTVNSDFVTFASASGVDAFFENGLRISSDTKIICIGEVTAKALKKYGVEDFRISETNNVQGITDTILQEVQK